MKQIKRLVLASLVTVALSGVTYLNGLPINVKLRNGRDRKQIDLPLELLSAEYVRAAISNVYDEQLPEDQIEGLIVSGRRLDLRDGAAPLDTNKIAEMYSDPVNYVLVKPGFNEEQVFSAYDLRRAEVARQMKALNRLWAQKIGFTEDPEIFSLYALDNLPDYNEFYMRNAQSGSQSALDEIKAKIAEFELPQH